MKKLLLCAFSLSLLFAACKKDETTTTPSTPSTTTPTIPTDGWTLNGTKHKQVFTNRQESQFTVGAYDATSKPIHTFSAFFNAYPTASGTYKIIPFIPDSTKPYPNQHVTNGEVVIIATIPNGTSNNTTYWCTGLEGKTATVTVTNGKLKVEVPEIAITSEAKDTIKLTGTINEM